MSAIVECQQPSDLAAVQAAFHGEFSLLTATTTIRENSKHINQFQLYSLYLPAPFGTLSINNL